MSAERPVAILVHGLWAHGIMMELLRSRLEEAGFEAISYSYPTMRLDLTENAELLAEYGRARNAPVIHWVGHSLGGLVILRMLEKVQQLPPGRAVLVGTPYHDSKSGRALADMGLGVHALGRSMGEWLEVDKPAVFPGREIGTIAGSVSVGLGRFIADDLAIPNDGVVAASETELPAACDHIVLSVSHIGMLISRRVARQTATFLREGRFQHPKTGG